jgi:hypothetical protein
MVKKTNNKNSSVGDNMVSAETMGNARSSMDNVIDDVVGAKKAKRGRPSKKEVDSIALRAKSVVLPPETTNDEASRSLIAPGGVKANGKNSVPAVKINKAVVISKDTAIRNKTLDEANDSENEEVNDDLRSSESQIRIQRRALLEYELKKVMAQLDELQEPIVTTTTHLRTNDADSNSDLEELPNEQRGAPGKGKKTLFNITASNKEGKLPSNERDDDSRQFERPTSYFEPVATVRLPLHTKTNGIQSACSSQFKAKSFYKTDDHDLSDDEHKDHGASYDNRINESIQRRRSEDEEENNRFQSKSYSDRYRKSNQSRFKNDERHRIQSGYRMKCPKFFGGEEDYDIWYLNMQAFFRLDNYTESEKIRIMLAQLGGEARSFIGHQDDMNFKSVSKLHHVLKEAFSEQLNKTETLMTCKQKAGEKIRSYGLRLRCLANKCGYEGEESDEWCLTVLKLNSLPYFANLLKNCMPDVTLDQAIKYLILNERTQVNSSKRSYETIDQIKDSGDDDGSSDEDSYINIKRLNAPNKSSYTATNFN